MLKDQIPVSTDKEVTVELLQSGKAKEEKEIGLLSWDLKLAPGDTQKIRLSYKIKSPKSKVIANL